MNTYDFDLLVIGGGSGGVRAARVAARHGARVAIVEEDRFGGTCVIRGCVPKKLLVYASRFRDEFADAAGFGWSVGKTSFDWPALIAAKDGEIARIERIYAGDLERAGVTILRARGTLESAHRVRLDADRHATAEKVLIATGATPVIDTTIPGIEHVITSNEALELPRLPRRLMIVGGGYIAVEFACLFHNLGVHTTLVYRGEEILRGFDGDLRRHLREAMVARGIDVRCGRLFTRIAQNGTALCGELDDGGHVDADAIMFAIGRKPNTAGLGLEQVGVRLGPNGQVAVDAYSRSSVPNIFAVGDVTDRVNLTPVAIREGHAFADSEFGGKPTAVDHTLVASAVFSTPELGTVGLSEETAREHHDAVDVYLARFSPLKAMLSGSGEKMLMKLIVDAATQRVLGAHVVGAGAAEMVQLLAIPLSIGATKAQFDATIAVHPTAAEELVTLARPSARYARN